LTEKN
jgi:hypothetical protein